MGRLYREIRGVTLRIIKNIEQDDKIYIPKSITKCLRDQFEIFFCATISDRNLTLFEQTISSETFP